MTHQRRRHTAVVILCVAAIALGGLLSVGMNLPALPLPQWTFLPDGAVRHVAPPLPIEPEWPLAPRSPSPSRAPPRG